jgi:phospholipid transport system transporter-binding protein
MTAERRAAIAAPSRKSGKARPKARARPGSGVIVLPAECTLQNLDALKERLVRKAQRRSAVTLDAGEVRRVDAAALQLLVAFVRDRRARGLATEWRAIADTLTDAARRLALHGSLDLSATAAVRS